MKSIYLIGVIYVIILACAVKTNNTGVRNQRRRHDDCDDVVILLVTLLSLWGLGFAVLTKLEDLLNTRRTDL